MGKKPEEFCPQSEVVLYGGCEWELQPYQADDPYEHRLIEIEGLGTIAGGCAPNLDTYLAMCKARVNSGVLAPEMLAQILDTRRREQVDVSLSDENGDAAGIVTEEVQKTVNTFAVTKDGGAIGLINYTFSAAIREGLSEMRTFTKNKGFRDRFSLGIRVNPLHIPLLRDGKPLLGPDEIECRTTHPRGPRGRTHAIKQMEVVHAPWAARVILSRRTGSPMEWKHVLTALDLLPSVRWGASRSQGYGSCRMVRMTEPVSGRL